MGRSFKNVSLKGPRSSGKGARWVVEIESLLIKYSSHKLSLTSRAIGRKKWGPSPEERPPNLDYFSSLEQSVHALFRLNRSRRKSFRSNSTKLRPLRCDRCHGHDHGRGDLVEA